MGTVWSERAATYLEATTTCPRCDELLDGTGVCRDCRADLRGEEARAVFAASVEAAQAVRQRQRLISALPTLPTVRAAAPAGAAATPPPTARAIAARPVVRPVVRSDSRVSVQSVLAVVGAGLFAIAAFVFRYLNPDLSDFATRSAIVGIITAVFLGTAWLLARAGLRFSAESVGALGVVFLGLDVSAIVTGMPGVATAGIAVFAASAVLIGIATLARLRSWLLAGLVGLVAAPALLGLPDTAGLLSASAAALLAHEIARRVANRFDGRLRAERRTATTLLVLAGIAMLGALLGSIEIFDPTSALPAAAAVVGLALLAAVATRNGNSAAWSAATGALAALAAVTASLALPLEGGPWLLAVVPTAAGIAALAVAAVPAAPTVDRRALLLGGWAALIVSGVPALYAGIMLVGTSPLRAMDRDWGAAAIIGVAVLALASLGVGLLARRIQQPTDAAPLHPARAPITTAVWLGAATLVTLASWSGWLPATQLALALAFAVALTLGAHRVSALRTPAALAAHALVLLAIALAAVDASLAVVGGFAIVPVILLLARVVRPAARVIHVGAAYAYALVVVARALDAAGLETIAILCLITSLASGIAFVATIVQRLHVRSWYAILVVTAIPFLLGVGSVLLERSGWTALSTSLILLFAVSLVTTQRPGLTTLVRAAAASILVPSLAVVVVCLGAALLDSSGSPIALPVIAAIVAATLPFTGIAQQYLERRGISAIDARIVRGWVEVSTILTAAIAVLLSLVRSAAGVEITLIVLAIIGLGGIAAGAFTGRRAFWVIGAAGLTGALWSGLILAGVPALEAYILPPALAAAVVGAVGVARGVARGAGSLPLFIAGLGASIIPSLGLVAVGDDGHAAVRTGALLASAAVLLALSRRFGGMPRLQPLVIPTLFAVILAASAGAVQGVVLGLANHAWTAEERTWSILALGLAAATLAGLAGSAIARRSPRLAATRALFVPAAVFLVAGSMAGVRMEVLPVVVLIALMLVLLGAMLLSTWRGLRGATALPPVWVLFGLAWLTAVVAWSPRELLRVEAFSLPLGAFLIAAGAIALRDASATGMRSWPLGYAGSWRLLAPGILVTLVPSVLATATDPRTERAILVIALALVAILLGSLLRLAAPFVLGILVLPIENVIVFAVQLGREIESAPWWITLATAGATLLVIAVTSERRSGGVSGVGAQLRDLA